MPSRAKLMPSAGSGTSGGTSSAGRSTSQEPSEWPAARVAAFQVVQPHDEGGLEAQLPAHCTIPTQF